MPENGVIGRVIAVQSTTLRVSLDIGSQGFTKAGPLGLQTVGVVNSYITVPAGTHRIVAIVTSVSIVAHSGNQEGRSVSTQDDQSSYELEATVVGRFEEDTFKSGLTGYPPLYAPVHSASSGEVAKIFLPKDTRSLRLGESAVSSEQDVCLDINLLLGHHCAVVGSTGSGKSCTVMGILDGLIEQSIPSGHIVIFDVNGEYAKAFDSKSSRGSSTRTVVLGPKLGAGDGLFLPHWFMNNEENLALMRASEGVQAPILQRSVADARATSVSQESNPDLNHLQSIQSSVKIIEDLSSKLNAQSPILKQLQSMQKIMGNELQRPGPCQRYWNDMERFTSEALSQSNLRNKDWEALTPEQNSTLRDLCDNVRQQTSQAFGVLGMGSSSGTPDFDAPVFYSLQSLCDYFLPNRVSIEQANDNKIGSYVATLQMRLSRLLADGRYDFMTRVEQHADPLGSYLRLLMGSDPTRGNAASDWPGAEEYRAQAAHHGDGPSVTIFDLSLVASDVLENVTALLGRLLFDFAVRSTPRAEHPMLLVLEEAHRFVPARHDTRAGESRSTAVFERIAKEGRKFGVSLLLASQRPSELSETVVAQCGTVIAHRLTHEADQNLLRHATALSSRSLLDQLSGLAQQHALVTGVSIGVPAAVRIRDIINPPESKDPDFLAKWSSPSSQENLDEDIARIVREWQGLPGDGNLMTDNLNTNLDPQEFNYLPTEGF